MAHIGRGNDLRHRHRNAREIGVADVAAAKDIGKRMAQKFTDAQLALRRPRFRAHLRIRARSRPPAGTGAGFWSLYG
jgi:hypothetical protein